MDKFNKLKSLFKNGGLLIIAVAATFYMLFYKTDIKSVISTIAQANPAYIVIAVMCMLVVVLCEAINIKRCMGLFKEKTNTLHCIYYSLTGVFFSSITPAATGGQPIQLCSMHKNKIKISNAALALLVCLASYQFVTVAMSIFAIAVKFSFFKQNLGQFNVLLYIGIFTNTALFVLILASIFSKKVIYRIILSISKIISKFNAEKADKFEKSALSEIDRYKNGAAAVKNEIPFIFKTVFITFVQILAFHSIPFWVYKSFGMVGESLISFILLQAALYITGAAMPLPGAVGIGESGFFVFFKLLFPAQIIGAAMLVSRGISFYFMILLSGIGILLFKVIMYKAKDKIKKLPVKKSMTANI